MEEGLLSLKWNNHKSTFFQILALLREKHTYTDVTLACDGRLYPVHKFILSTCSEYFSDIFNSNSGNNIVIVLKDVRRQDLEYLLDYMYLGQVDVAQSELSSLIKTAECLKIKGLAIPDDEPQTASRRVAEEREPDISPPSKKKRHHADDNRTIGVSANSSNNISSRIQPILAIPPPSLPPHTMQQQALLQRLQVPVSQPQIPPTSQFGGKSHPSSMTHITSPRTVHVTTSSTHPSHAPPLSSPTQPSAMPVIKQEVTEPPEIDYGHENFEDAKPDVSESQHLDQDMAVAGPSGIQGSADNWDGESDLGGYAGGEAYSEGSLEETGVDSEAQGGSSTRDTHMGDAEEFLRRLEDQNNQQGRQSVPFNVPSAPYSPEGGGVVFSGTNTQLANRPYYSRPMFPTSGGSLISCTNVNNGSAPCLPESPYSLACHLCSYTGSSVQDLVTHRQNQHLELIPPHSQTQSLESLPPHHQSQSLESLPPHHQSQSRDLLLPHRKNDPSKRLACLKFQQQKPSSEERMFKCPYCTVVATGRHAIENHVVSHSVGDGGYWCSYCTLKCRSAPGLSSHMKRHEYQGDF